MFNLSLYPYQDCTPSRGKSTWGETTKDKGLGVLMDSWAPGRGQEQQVTRPGRAIPPWEIGSYGVGVGGGGLQFCSWRGRLAQEATSKLLRVWLSQWEPDLEEQG